MADETDHSEEVYGLLVSFPDQSESFVLGFEAGQVFQRMQDGEQEIALTGHGVNLEVFNRTAAAMGYTMTWMPPAAVGETGGEVDLHGEWLDFRFVPGSPKPPLSLVPTPVPEQGE